MLKRFSLIKQLLIVFGILAILDVALLMPLVDYNMNAIIDKQMFNKLEEVQNSYKYRREELNHGFIEDSEMEEIGDERKSEI